MTNEMENSEAIGEITELDTEEVSLVDRAANKKRFLIVKKEKKDEVVEKSEVAGAEAVSEAGTEGAGDSLGSGEGQADDSREEVTLVADTEANSEVASDSLKDDELLKTASDALQASEDKLVDKLAKEFESFRSEHTELKKAIEGASLAEVREELAKAKAELAESISINKQFRDLLAKAVAVLTPSNPETITKSEAVASNKDSTVLESSLQTRRSTGFFQPGVDLNTKLKRDKK